MTLDISLSFVKYIVVFRTNCRTIMMLTAIQFTIQWFTGDVAT